MIPRQSLGPLPLPLPLPRPPWTLKPVCRQERIRSAHSGLKSPLLTRSARTSRPEDLGQPRVVQSRKPVEDPRPVHAALGQQEMQVRVKIDPGPEGLDGDDDAGAELFARQGLEAHRER